MKYIFGGGCEAAICLLWRFGGEERNREMELECGGRQGSIWHFFEDRESEKFYAVECEMMIDVCSGANISKECIGKNMMMCEIKMAKRK